MTERILLAGRHALVTPTPVDEQIQTQLPTVQPFNEGITSRRLIQFITGHREALAMQHHDPTVALESRSCFDGQPGLAE